MIFIGDIAIPDSKIPVIKNLPVCFNNQPVVANLEGAIVHDARSFVSERKVFNSEAVISFIKNLNIKVVSLGNNHITDVPSAFSHTCNCLNSNDISYCGAGMNPKDAAKPAMITENGVTYAFLSFGWDVISCKYVSDGVLGVNPLEKDNVVECVKETRLNYPEAKIVLLPHWDYELEIYPMPMHRELARLAIDAGADAIFGHHPHCVQGYEIYKDKPIIYSLGNWYIPHGIYMRGNLKFPAYAHTECAIEWTDEHLICHWFSFSLESQELIYQKSENIFESKEMRELSPFVNMSIEEYKKWFSRNRKKKKLLPIFVSYDNVIKNSLYKRWLKMRQRGINLLSDNGIKKNRSGAK